MVSKKNKLSIAAIVTIFSFFTVVYVSCSKGNHGFVRCEGVICENDGYCHMDTLTNKPKCVCPTGYEGANCSIVSVAKFYGSWDVKQVITGSDSSAYIGQDTSYIAFLKKSGTPTTFLIDNFFNNPYYNNIICTIDSPNTALGTSHFNLDTLSAYHMVYNNFGVKIGFGTISSSVGSTALDSINAVIVIRYKNRTTNWEVDTVTLAMKLHKL